MLDLCVRSLDLYDGWIAALAGEGARSNTAAIGTLEIALDAGRAPRALRRGHTASGSTPAAVARLVPHSRRRGRRICATTARLRRRAAARAGARAVGGAPRRDVRRGARRVHQSPRRQTRSRRHGPRATRSRPIPSCSPPARGRTASMACATPPLRPVRGQLLHAATGSDGAASPTILWGPDCYIVRRVGRPVCSSARRSRTQASTSDDGRGRERPARRRADAAADAAREATSSTRASASARRRPTNCRCSAPIPPSPASSTRQATTATASCSRRSPPNLIARSRRRRPPRSVPRPLPRRSLRLRRADGRATKVTKARSHEARNRLVLCLRAFVRCRRPVSV